MQITSSTLLYIGIASICLGVIVGLFVFFYGRKKGKQTLGVVGLVVSIVTGAIGPLLPIIVLVVFFFLISRKAPLNRASDEPIAEKTGQDEGSAV